MTRSHPHAVTEPADERQGQRRDDIDDLERDHCAATEAAGRDHDGRCDRSIVLDRRSLPALQRSHRLRPRHRPLPRRRRGRLHGAAEVTAIFASTIAQRLTTSSTPTTNTSTPKGSASTPPTWPRSPRNALHRGASRRTMTVRSITPAPMSAAKPGPSDTNGDADGVVVDGHGHGRCRAPIRPSARPHAAPRRGFRCVVSGAGARRHAGPRRRPRQ